MYFFVSTNVGPLPHPLPVLFSLIVVYSIRVRPRIQSLWIEAFPFAVEGADALRLNNKIMIPALVFISCSVFKTLLFFDLYCFVLICQLSFCSLLSCSLLFVLVFLSVSSSVLSPWSCHSSICFAFFCHFFWYFSFSLVLIPSPPLLCFVCFLSACRKRQDLSTKRHTACWGLPCQRRGAEDLLGLYTNSLIWASY